MSGGNFIIAHTGSRKKRALHKGENAKSLTMQERLSARKARKYTHQLTLQEARAVGAREYADLLEMNEKIMAFEKIDVNNPEQVQERIKEYFDVVKTHKQKPTLAGLALSLGVSRDKLKRMATNANGKVNEQVSEEIQKVYIVYESLWESYMLNGDIPPLNGIFIGKNQFGYKDVVEQNNVVEVRPQIDAEAIRMKYIGADNELPSGDKK